MPPKTTKTISTKGISVVDFKQSAKRLVELMKQRDISLKHSEALEMMSHIEGYKDYNTFVAAAKIHNEDINSRLHKLLSDFENTENKVNEVLQYQEVIQSKEILSQNGHTIEEIINELENILYFYEDTEGNFLKISRAFDVVVDFFKSNRVEDFIIVELHNNFITLKKSKVSIYDKNNELMDIQDILKNIFKVYKDLTIKKYSVESINYTLMGKLLKNFEYSELNTIYSNAYYECIYNKSYDDFGFLINKLIIKIDDEEILSDLDPELDNESLILKAEEIVNKYNLQNWDTYKHYINAISKYKIGNGFIIHADGENLYYPGIGNLEERANDSIYDASRNFIINAVEYVFDKVGLSELLKNELDKAQFFANGDNFASCSQDVIKLLIKNGNPKAKAFSFDINAELCKMQRIDIY